MITTARQDRASATHGAIALVVLAVLTLTSRNKRSSIGDGPDDLLGEGEDRIVVPNRFFTISGRSPS